VAAVIIDGKGGKSPDLATPLPICYALGGKAGVTRANRELLALILFHMMHPDIGAPPTASDERLHRNNIWYVLALGAELGYEVGVDAYGIAHVDLPTGHVTFELSMWRGSLHRTAPEIARARVDEFWRLIFPPEVRNAKAGSSVV
jgi:hypothetical protein